MTEYPDAVEIAAEVFQRNAMVGEVGGMKVVDENEVIMEFSEIAEGCVESARQMFAALLQDSGEAGVRVFVQKCENCRGTGNEGFPAGETGAPCPDCQGKGYSYKVSVLEPQDWCEAGHWLEEPGTGCLDESRITYFYRDRPIKEG